MSLRQRSVIGTVVDALGQPVKNGNLSFKLDKPEGYTDTHVIVNRAVNVKTDTNGAFSASLWCDEDSEVALNYVVTFPIANDGMSDDAHSAEFSLAFGAGTPVQISSLINPPEPPIESGP